MKEIIKKLLIEQLTDSKPDLPSLEQIIKIEQKIKKYICKPHVIPAKTVYNYDNSRTIVLKDIHFTVTDIILTCETRFADGGGGRQWNLL